jgi:glycosyltransferase involved in cell wall biosynthesis
MKETMTKPKISILLPTRKRTDAVVKSISSLLANAQDTSNIEILIAYDDDDQESRDFFANVWTGFIGQTQATTKVFETERFGYLRLYKYVNFLAEQASGDWIMFWNDDALMLTENWDAEVIKEAGYWGLLRMPCVNMNHPFALFPIIPRTWVDYFDQVSPVNHSDWWIYHVTNTNNRLKNLSVNVYHDRADVTGGNNDDTFKEQSYAADGRDPTNPEDYSHPDRILDLQTWIGKFAEKIKHDSN